MGFCQLEEGEETFLQGEEEGSCPRGEGEGLSLQVGVGFFLLGEVGSFQRVEEAFCQLEEVFFQLVVLFRQEKESRQLWVHF